ncbi:nitrilase-related carbon-nitrogen hydrolase [Cryobacterium sp. 10C2]|uniref:nitrilase-related carbon-nitrogen hydrolase n=1 Tax=Cryobacterium sp. 10C2 TaxID=3048576 RepID=UPI002AB42D4C|nr:nitrilase-related carbon-nitrogen hydrolase [Cryobacterium sp. 10C2]MDY7529977.1 nitrilase-related carbon-nitrogen hydrolase [Cryobacterium sp. 10C2]MEB0292060.1 nitrilase-related carbon-nitrogen hydrolase [Cryobacterium sp. 10C2]
MIRIACRQLAPVIPDLAGNVERSVAAVRESVAAGARLVVLPELVTTGYMFSSQEEARSVAVTTDHPVFAQWALAVAGVDGVVVGGFAELGADGLVYNSLAVVDGSGVLGSYRKTHLWDREKLVFTPGTAVPPVVDTALGRLGVLICYDLEFPEMTRSLALRGAELIVVPTNWPRETVPEGERVPEVTVAMAAAYTSHVGVVCCDRSGTERGQDWNEASSIINEHGWVVATADASGIAMADLDLLLSRDKTITPLCDAFGDRRPELYSEVVAPR